MGALLEGFISAEQFQGPHKKLSELSSDKHCASVRELMTVELAM